MDFDHVVERLRGGASVALGVEPADRRRVITRVEHELTALGRTVLWVDLSGVQSGAELAGRIVETCLPYLDPEELGDVLERVPARGRLDLEALAELMMLPERVAAQIGKRTVALIEGFDAAERAVGFPGLGAMRDALMMRERVAYLFVGSARVPALFSRPNSPLYGMAEAVEPDERPRVRDRRAPREPDPTPAPAEPFDPLAAALLSWAEPPAKEKKAPEPDQRDAWRRLLQEEEFARRWLAEHQEDDEDDPWTRRRRRRR